MEIAPNHALANCFYTFPKIEFTGISDFLHNLHFPNQKTTFREESLFLKSCDFFTKIDLGLLYVIEIDFSTTARVAGRTVIDIDIYWSRFNSVGESPLAGCNC